MNDRVRTLTPEENKRLVELSLRQIHIGQCVRAMKHESMAGMHETGFTNIEMFTLLCESAGWVNLEIESILEGE